MDRTQGETPRSPIVWLNLLCLDAPLVAVSWQWLFAYAGHATVSAPARAALFLTAWLIYLVDRLGDVLSLDRANDKSARQEFAAKHRALLIGIAAAVGIANAFAISKLDHATFVGGVVIGLAAIAYLAANVRTNIWRVVPAKEISIGTLFALGTVLVPLIHTDTKGFFVLPLVLFAAVCSLNCICIAVWERELDLLQAKESLATRWPAVGRFTTVAGLSIAAAACVFAFVQTETALLLFCIGSSSLLLAALDVFASRIQRDARTALADLALLTPLIFICSGGV